MSTLWVRTADEVRVPGPLTDSEQARLAAVFAPTASPWARALETLGLPRPPGSCLRFHLGIPYFNATALAYAVSQGASVPVRAGDGVAYESRGGFFSTLRQLRAQGRAERYLAGLPTELPSGDAALEESVALGLVVQLLLLRLPARSEADLARWLARPEAAPATTRATLRKMLSVQARRTQLSPAWERLFAAGVRPAMPDSPDRFWNEPPPEENTPPKVEARARWRGIPICGGQVEGALVLEPEGSGVLLFPHARPETVEHFHRATALLFAEGGALAHACCVAREQGIPAVSGLGRGFLAEARSRTHARVRVDGESGEVEFL